MNRPEAAMILAAGFGTRMGDLTRSCPKPLLEVSGKALIDHALDLLVDAQIPRAVINIHYLGHMLGAHLEDRTDPALTFSPEDPILDTGGGVVNALPALGRAPFCTLNSDAIFSGPNPIEGLAEAWSPADMDALLLLVPTTNARAYTRNGDFLLDPETGTPSRRGTLDSAPFVYAGAQIITPDAFNDCPDGPFSMNIVWDRLLATGRLKAAVYPGLWVDVGTPDGLLEAERVLNGHRP